MSGAAVVVPRFLVLAALRTASCGAHRFGCSSFVARASTDSSATPRKATPLPYKPLFAVLSVIVCEGFFAMSEAVEGGLRRGGWAGGARPS